MAEPASAPPPSCITAQYGADSLRLYEMFMGPLRDTKVGAGGQGGACGHHAALGSPWPCGALFVSLRAQALASIPARSPPALPCPALSTTQVWSTKGVEGVHRFLARVYRLVTEQPLSEAEPDAEQLRLLHQTIKKASGGVAGWPGGRGPRRLLRHPVHRVRTAAATVRRRAHRLYPLALHPTRPSRLPAALAPLPFRSRRRRRRCGSTPRWPQ